MAESGKNKKVANSVVALSSAAVMAVYAAGYLRTRSAADRFALQALERRPVVPAPPRDAAPIARVYAPAPPTISPDPGSNRQRVETSRRTALPKRSRARVDAPAPEVPLPTTVAAPPESVVAMVEATPAAPVIAPAPVEPPAPEAPAAPPPAPAPQYKDGTYFGWGTSRHGDIQAAVVIENGRIESARIAECLTRYSCSWIAALPPEVAARQSPEVDYVSGATQSTNAFYYAVVEALSKAK